MKRVIGIVLVLLGVGCFVWHWVKEPQDPRNQSFPGNSLSPIGILLLVGGGALLGSFRKKTDGKAV